MKNYHIPLEHILMLAFEPSVTLGKKRSISLETFIEFRKTLLKKANKWFDNPIMTEELERYAEIDYKLNFESEIDLKELEKLVKEKSNVFSFDGTTIFIRDEIDFEQMEAIRCQYRDEADQFIISHFDAKGLFDKDCVDILKLTDFEKLMAEYAKFEKVVEGLYESGLVNPKDKKQIYAFQITRLSILKKIALFLGEEEIAKSFLMYSRQAKPEMPPLFDISELQQYGGEGFAYDLNYINNSLFKRDEFFTALFTNLPLAFYKLHSTLSDFLDILGLIDFKPITDITEFIEPIEGWDEYLKRKADELNEQDIYDFESETTFGDEEDEDIEYPEEMEDSEDERQIVFAQDTDGNMVCFGASKQENNSLRNGYLLFVLQYIAYIDIYHSENERNEELEMVKRRLCYITSPDADFSTSEGRTEFLSKMGTLSVELIEKNYGSVGTYFIDDIFLSKNPKDVLKKLIFIKTALGIFPDNDYKETFEFYKEHPKFDEYYSFVFDSDREKPQKRERIN